jgi:hypothetical protein
MSGPAPLSRNKGYPRRSGYMRIEHDHYVEPPWVVHALLDVETFDGSVLDPCCGVGTIPSVCLGRGIAATGSDIVDHGTGAVRDLFTITEPVANVITNVPYGIAEDCARHLLRIVQRKLAMILPMTFWESAGRDPFFREHPPLRFYPCSDRPSMPPPKLDGERDRYGAIIQPPSSGGTMPYGWFIWQRCTAGTWQRGLHGTTVALRLPLTPRSVRLGTRARPHAKRCVAGSQAQQELDYELSRNAPPARVGEE